jgi:hypothetical protein
MADRKAKSAASAGKKPDSGPKTRIQQQTRLKSKNAYARLGAPVSQLPGWDGKIRLAHKSRTWKLGQAVRELQRRFQLEKISIQRHRQVQPGLSCRLIQARIEHSIQPQPGGRCAHSPSSWSCSSKRVTLHKNSGPEKDATEGSKKGQRLKPVQKICLDEGPPV